LEAVESNHACPPEMAAKSLDLNKALIFFSYFFASRQKSNDAKINYKSFIINILGQILELNSAKYNKVL
jgi:hypothetical protein